METWTDSAVVVVPAFAEAISGGVKAGVPLTGIVQTADSIGGHPFQAGVRRFTIGPLLNVRLLYGLGVEFGAMYKRFDRQAGQIQIIIEAGMPYQEKVSPYSQTGRSWEFPIVGQYRFSGGLVRPISKPAYRSITLAVCSPPSEYLSHPTAYLRQPVVQNRAPAS